MTGLKLAVTGMGRSGIGVAKAAARRGAIVTLYDERLVESPEQIEQVEALQAVGVQVVPGWHGRFEEPDFEVLVTSPGFARNHPALRDAERAGVPIWSEVEFAYQISEAPIVAITGTNGKSTTVILTWLMARSCTEAILCGNLSGSGYPELTLTEAAELSTPDQVLIAEVSSFQLEWVHEFAPSVAAITNITPDHLDRHPTFGDYRDTKLRIFAAQAEHDVAVINVSERTLKVEEVLKHIVSGVEVRFIGETGTSESLASSYDAGHLQLSGLGAVALNDLPLYGTHNAVNAVMAWEICGAALGRDKEPRKMLEALKSFHGLENRMERLGVSSGVTIVNNSMCTNPAAVIANSQAIAAKQWILMGGVTKGLDFSPVREYLTTRDHTVVLFGPKLENGLHDQLGTDWRAHITLEEAFKSAMAQAQPGDVVMLSPGCASAPPYANFRERGEAFRALVAEWLKEHQG